MSNNQVVVDGNIWKRLNIAQQIVSAIVACLTAVFMIYAFVFNTSKTIESHTLQIKEMHDDVEQIKTVINDNEVYKGVSTTEIKSLEEKVNGIEVKMDKMDDKLDKILMTRTK